MPAQRFRQPSGVTSANTNFIQEVKTIRKETTDNTLTEALEAALDKKAQDIVILDLDEVCSFTDHFVICTGTSSRHNQTIAEGIDERLRKLGARPLHIEGHKEGEWILLDYVDFNREYLVSVLLRRAELLPRLAQSLSEFGSALKVAEHAYR